MKTVGDMSRVELAAYIGAEFKKHQISMVLSGTRKLSCLSNSLLAHLAWVMNL